MQAPAPEGKAEVLQLKRETEQLLSATRLALAKSAGQREALVHQVDEAERKLAFLTDELERVNRQAESTRNDLEEVSEYARGLRQRLVRWMTGGGPDKADVPVPPEPEAMNRALRADRPAGGRLSHDPQAQEPFQAAGGPSNPGCMPGNGPVSRAKAPVLRYPVDFHRLAASGALLPKFEPIQVDRRIPFGYPFELVLPLPIGNKNDFGYFVEAINQLGCVGEVPDRALGVVAWVRSKADLESLAQGIASQTLPRSRFSVTVFIDTEEVARPVAWADLSLEGPPWRRTGQKDVRLLESKADVIVFLDGWGRLDCHLLERIARYASVSIPLVLGLLVDGAPGSKRAGHNVQVEHIVQEWKNARFPFSKLQDFNFAIGRGLLEEVGGFNPNFQSVRKAVMELCYRAYNHGAYFIPLPAAKSASGQAPRSWGWDAEINDDRLFQQLVPVNWYRKVDGNYEIPKVSIYIPAYNAEEFICDAINSVLDQDFEDLEVCVHVDGASDGTLDVLEKNYAGNSRVRWSVDANSGIAYASNRAIGLARGLYIGQLDSDDRLKPGAIKRLAGFLDDHADVGCVYSSAVRVDREGRYLRDEYNWPIFSREKMMLMSIAHHFRMFRRQAWQRTEGFREDLSNAVDYDMFLKLSEVTGFHHIDEKLYERRWHGHNTSSLNEEQQTRNTHVCQGAALERQGLSAGWQVSVPDRSRPRRVGYTRKAGRKRVAFWPDRTGEDPYQRLLYRDDLEGCDFISGDIEVAIRMAREADDPENVFFHLHWLKPLLQGAKADAEALQRFLKRVQELQGLGGKVVWTVHDCVTPDAGCPAIEQRFLATLAASVDRVHVHAESSVPEVEQSFPVPRSRVFVTRHGGYRGVYPDFVSREVARRKLGLAESDVAILCFGEVCPRKSLDPLLNACGSLVRRARPISLILAGEAGYDVGKDVDATGRLKGRVRLFDRRIDDMELQVLFHAADVGVFPGQHVLVPGALMLSLSFGLPAVVPSVGVTREVLAGRDAGFLYGPGEELVALEDALFAALDAMDDGRWEAFRTNAKTIAGEARWPGFMTGMASADAAGCSGEDAAS